MALGRVVCICVLASVCRQGSASPAVHTNAPVICFLSPVYDFGTALAGDAVEHVFEFTNAGSAVLEILGVYPSCSCTMPGEWTQKVLPSHAGSVALLLDTSRFEGPIAESTTVASTDPVHFNVALRFKGTVHKPLELTPRTVVLKPVINAPLGDSNITRIVNYLSESILLEKPKSDNPFIVPRLKAVAPGREFELAVTTPPARRSAPFQGTISIKTSSTRVPMIAFPVLVMPQTQGQTGSNSTRSGSGAAASAVPPAGANH